MGDDQKPKPKVWSQSDRAELDEFLEERRFQERLAEHNAKMAEVRKRRIDGLRGWASLFTFVVGVVTLVTDKLAALWKHFITWAAGA